MRGGCMRKKKFILILTAACAVSSVFGFSACEHRHSYSTWEIVREANCTEDGLRMSTCSCGEKRLEIITASHIEVIDSAVEANCDVEGLTEGKHCERCGKILVEQHNLGVKHEVEIREGVASTCSEQGFTDEEHCTKCKKTLKAQKKLKLLPHMFEEGVCTECGVPQPSEGITYRPVYDNNEIVSYCVKDGAGCADSNVVIADSYEGLPVTAVADAAFSGNKIIQTVFIPKSVLSIGSSAFFACGNLSEATVGEGVKSIGDNAFAKCTSLIDIELPASITALGTGVFWDCVSLEFVRIPDGVETLKADAFFGCLGLKSVALGKGLKQIGERAFCWCTALYEVALPEGLTEIGDRAFGACRALKRVTLSSTVEKIGSRAFQECISLIEICNASKLELIPGSDSYGGIALSVTNLYTPEEGSSKFTVTEDGFLFYSDNGEDARLVGYVGGESAVILPESFKNKRYTVATNAFFGVSPQVTSVTVTCGVEKIEVGAFGAGGQIKEFRYLGTTDAWTALPKEEFWRYLTGFDEVICSDGKVTRDGRIIMFDTLVKWKRK